MEYCGLLVPQSWGHVTGHAEVGVLVDCFRDYAGDVSARAEYVRETVGETGNCLQWGIGPFADVVTAGEAETALHLVHCGVFLHSQEVRVEVVDVGGVCEDEGLVHVEAACDYIADVFFGEVLHVLEREFGPVEVFFVVGYLDHHWDVEDVLHPFVEDKWNHVAQVQG